MSCEFCETILDEHKKLQKDYARLRERMRKMKKKWGYFKLAYRQMEAKYQNLFTD